MTPERLALVTALCPAWADFEREGAIVHVYVTTGQTVVGQRTMTITYELVMHLRTVPGGPFRTYEIRCEGVVVKTGSY